MKFLNPFCSLRDEDRTYRRRLYALINNLVDYFLTPEGQKLLILKLPEDDQELEEREGPSVTFNYDIKRWDDEGVVRYH